MKDVELKIIRLPKWSPIFLDEAAILWANWTEMDTVKSSSKNPVACHFRCAWQSIGYTWAPCTGHCLHNRNACIQPSTNKAQMPAFLCFTVPYFIRSEIESFLLLATLVFSFGYHLKCINYEFMAARVLKA